MDLNLYLGLPPLPQPPGRLDVAADYPPPPNSGGSAVVVANEQRSSSEPQEVAVAPPAATPPLPVVVPTPPAGAAYSPSNALSTPEQVLVDPVAAWLVDPVDQRAVPLETPSNMAMASSAPAQFARYDAEFVQALEAAGERRRPQTWLVQSGRAIPTALIRGAEIAAARRESAQASPAATERMTPENRLRRLIQVSDQHRIGRGGPGQVSRGHHENSPEADSLAQSINRSHNSLEASRRQKLDGDGKVGKTDAAKKDDSCGGCHGSFECNICLESAKDPVVTPCGHLFCWPCIYQWLHRHSEYSDCPVCKSELFEVNVTPIYGRGSAEQNSPINGIKIPPRPSAQRTESLRQQLQMPDRGIANMVRRLIQNQDIVAGQAASSAGVERTGASAPRPRARGRRQARQDQNATAPVPATQQQVGNADTGGGNQAPLPPPDANDAAPAVAVAPQQSSSVEQASTSSTVGVAVGGPAQGRRSRNSESTPTTTRRTRRRQQ
uniref:E3 ubiquitin-protein ligase RMA n=2 Tax=Oryza brachyantha TaxID=4533 RepID=J3MQM5_ORYBR